MSVVLSTEVVFQSADSPRFLISQGLVPMRIPRMNMKLPIAHSLKCLQFSSVIYAYTKLASEIPRNTRLVFVRSPF